MELNALDVMSRTQRHARLRYASNAWEPASGTEQSTYSLAKLGYEDAEQVQRWLGLLRSAPAYRRLDERDRKRADAIMPDLLAYAASCPDPDATLRSCLNLVERLQHWPGYLDVLGVHPSVLRRLVSLVGASPWLGQFLYNHVELLDQLLAEHYLCQLPDGPALRTSLGQMLDDCGDDEAAQIVALRNFKHSHVLHIVSLDLEGLLSLEEVSRALSQLADLLLECVLEQVSEKMGLGSKPPLGIIGYGKLGSREMTYASDTDIVFIYDEQADIPEPKLTRLARCVNQWLTEPTTAGVLYATDFRLRPYGDSGLLISSLAAFREYQRRHAWIWEHQALTRARWIAGEPRFGEAFQSIRHEILVRERDPQRLRDEVLAMRDRISEAHQEATGAFNVKHSRGGIIDVEFAVQHLVLRHAGEYPELVSYTDNESVLSAAARLHLVPAGQAADANEAFRQYRAWMHRERLRGNEVIEMSEQEAKPHRDAVFALWRHVFGQHAGVGETFQPVDVVEG